MKKMLAVFALLAGLAIPGRAQTMTNAQAVKVVIPYQTTCATASLTTTATDVTFGNSTTITSSAGINAVKVTNWDAAIAVNCSEGSGVTGSTGDQIAPQATANAPLNYLSWNISTSQKWYCASASSTVKVTICRTK